MTLANQAMKILLFGKIGSGKSFVGEFIEREYGLPYYDADQDLPRAIVEAIRAHRPISEQMREGVTEKIIERIHLLQNEHQEFCVAQALFKNRQRVRLLEEFPDLRFVWVRSEPPQMDVRLRERTGHVASHYYADTVNPQFEPPSMAHWILENVADPSELHVRVANLLESLRFGEPDQAGNS